MATIDAKSVSELRSKTGAGMMDCKKALSETAGDFEQAIDWLRKKGLAAAAKKAGRIASEGLVWSYLEPGKCGALAEVNSETDFVTQSDAFKAFITDLAKHVALSAPKFLNSDEPGATADTALMTQKYLKDPTRTVNEALQDLVAKLGENIKIRRFARYDMTGGAVNCYLHMGGKVGVLVKVECANEAALNSDAFKEFTKDICLHICANKPSYLTSADVPAAVIVREKEIALDQAKQTGKPEQFLTKIVEGKVSKYYDANCLVDQDFVKDPTTKVRDVIKALTAKIGAPVKVLKFERFEMGEGLEKKVEDFAAEVAAKAGITH